MNRFRVNLHPALFDGLEARRENLESTELTAEFTRQLETLKTPILDEFQAATNNFLSDVNQNQEQEIISRYSDITQLRLDQKRFFERINLQNNWKKYSDLWNAKITQGFWHLINELKEVGYFNGKNLNVEVWKLKEKYWNEVKQQFINNVWFAGKKKFERVKDILFWTESENYPANKIYCESVPWAISIFTVDRISRISMIDWWGLVGDKFTETTTDKEDRDFLSNDLPEYLWNIKKTPWILKALSWLPIFSVKEYRSSLQDRKAIKNFLKVASRITIREDSPYKGKDTAVVLFEMFEKNSDLNLNDPQKYKAKLAEYGIEYRPEDFDDILRVWAFYVKTQAERLKSENQHPIYLGVLEIIRQKGWVKQAISDLKNLVEEAKRTKKEEKKLWYETGKMLSGGSKEFAKKLGIRDFARVTRLTDLVNKKENGDEKGEKHFEQDELIILADLDNNGVITPNDIEKWWTQTWMQFLDICKLVGKDKALDNLIKRAKLQNKLLNLGLEDSEISQESIKGGNLKVILLLQNIIAKPGGDLYSLLSWEQVLQNIEQNARKVDITEDKEIMEACSKLAEQKLMDEKINGQWLKERLQQQLEKENNNIDLGFDNFADLQASLATFLYDNYKLWVWVWSTVSFDRWARWLKIWTWVQLRDKKQWAFWLSITYDRSFALGNNWTLNSALNAWAFLPIAAGDVNEIWLSIWSRISLDKETINIDKHITRNAGVDAWFTYVIGSGAVVYLWYHNRRNKAKNTDIFSQVESKKFTEKMMSEIIEKIAEQNQGILKLTNDGQLNSKIYSIIDSKLGEIKKEDVDKDILKAYKRSWMSDVQIFDAYKQALKADIMRILAKYDGIQIDNATEPIILSKIRSDYENLRRESYKSYISDGRAYFSWYSAWVFWSERGAWVYAAVDVTKHSADGYGFIRWENYELDVEHKEAIDDQIIQSINSRLGLQGSEQLTLKGDYIVVPKSVTHMVKVSESMKGLMTKDENGNILISKRTSWYEKIGNETTTRSVELCLWKWGDADFKYSLNTLKSDRFSKSIDSINSTILTERNKELYTENILGSKLKEIVGIGEDNSQNVAQLILNYLNGGGLIGDQKLKITIKNDWKNNYEVVKVEKQWLWSSFEVDYMESRELFDAEAREQAQKVYNWAADLRDPTAINALYYIKHPHPGIPQYQNFASKLYEGEFEEAKDIFEKQIKSKLTKFPDIAWPQQKTTLWQLLMSINNIFARANNVIWWGTEKSDVVSVNKYEIRGETLWSIIGRRARQISNTIKENRNINSNIKSAYEACIGAIDTKRVNDSRYAGNQAQSASLNNTVWFNLWDKTNPENPLLGVEVYDKVYDSKDLVGNKFTEEQRTTLHKHAMENFIGNEALFSAIWQVIWQNHEQIKQALKKARFTLEWNTWKLRLDFNNNNYIILSADMKLGYYTQCVNHTIILDNILVDVNGNKISYNSDSWRNGIVSSSTVDVITSSVTYSGWIAFNVSNEHKKEQGANVKTDEVIEWGKQFETSDGGAPDPNNPDPANPGSNDYGGEVEY